MSVSVSDRIGLGGVVVALLGIGVFYLWPRNRWIGWLAVLAACVVLLIWAWAERRSHPFWSAGCATVVVVGVVVAIGLRPWRSGKPKSSSLSASSAPRQAKMAVPPAGFMRFLGQIAFGKAGVIQENQTAVPLDDVLLSVTEDIPNDRDPRRGTVVWQKDIPIGTVRARLTDTLPVGFPIPARPRLLRFTIIMYTRYLTYREMIYLTRESETEYKAKAEFFGADILHPLFVETDRLVVFKPRR